MRSRRPWLLREHSGRLAAGSSFVAQDTSPSNPTNPRKIVSERPQNDAAIQAFFDRWEVYQRLVDNDYMAHRGIHAALRKSLASRKAAFSVLDLGCGDGSLIAASLQGLPVSSYTGVDLSAVALDLGRERFADSAFECRFVQSNLADYLPLSVEEKVDVIIAGFALHHLSDEKKREVFKDCHTKLSPGGAFYLFDVFRRAGQPRKEYLASYCNNLESNWVKLSNEERSNICEHIRENDFPASYDVMAAFAKEAGFTRPDRPLFEDSLKFHRLYRFSLDLTGFKT